MSGLRPRPRFYEHAVSGFAGPTRPKADEPRVAVFYSKGIFSSRQPNLSVSYLLAARCLIEDSAGREGSEAVAMPVSFLQRHALELAIKDLIESANGIDVDSDRLKALREDRAAFQRRFPETARWEHGLVKLTKDLSKALEAVGYELPDAIAMVAKRLNDFEKKDASATRYPGLLGVNFEVRMSETQNELENVFEAYLHPVGLLGLPENLADDLINESNAIGQEEFHRSPGDFWRVQFFPSAQATTKWGFTAVRSVSPEEQLSALLKTRPELRPCESRKEPDGSLKVLLDWTDAEKRRQKQRRLPSTEVAPEVFDRLLDEMKKATET